MKNCVKLFGIIVLTAIIGLTTTSCASTGNSGSRQTVITISGMDQQFNNMYAFIGLTNPSGDTEAVGMPQRIRGETITWEMLNTEGNDASIEGRHSVVIRISESSVMNEHTVFIYDGIAPLQSIGRGRNTIPFDRFNQIK